MFHPLGDLNSSLDPGVGVRTHGADVIRLGATDLGSEVSDRAQQGILGGIHVAGTSAPEHMAPSSAPHILAPTSAPCVLAPSMDSSLWPPQLSLSPSLALYLSPPSHRRHRPGPPSSAPAPPAAARSSAAVHRPSSPARRSPPSLPHPLPHPPSSPQRLLHVHRRRGQPLLLPGIPVGLWPPMAEFGGAPAQPPLAPTGSLGSQ